RLFTGWESPTGVYESNRHTWIDGIDWAADAAGGGVDAGAACGGGPGGRFEPRGIGRPDCAPSAAIGFGKRWGESGRVAGAAGCCEGFCIIAGDSARPRRS